MNDSEIIVGLFCCSAGIYMIYSGFRLTRKGSLNERSIEYGRVLGSVNFLNMLQGKLQQSKLTPKQLIAYGWYNVGLGLLVLLITGIVAALDLW
jgi:hypothetical protein